MKPIAIVIPWYGEKEIGGAETQAWELSHKLSEYVPVEVLTSYSSDSTKVYEWQQKKYSKSKEKIRKVLVRRFKIDPIDFRKFDIIVNNKLLSYPQENLIPNFSPIPTNEENEFLENLIHSKSLERYLKLFHYRYQAFIFLPYLFSFCIRPIFHIPKIQNRTFLHPCLHDEVYAYLNIIREYFFKAKGIFYFSEGEKELATKLYGPSIIPKSYFIGGGIDGNIKSNFYTNNRYPFLERENFLLCLGRKTKYKNTDFLVHSFSEYKKKNPDSKLKLVLAGAGDSYNGNDIYDLGKVSEEEKEWLLQNMLLLVNPSTNESFSRVVMEAWIRKKAVVVNGNCLATKIPTEKCNGGFAPINSFDWMSVFSNLEDIPKNSLLELGENGYRYAEQNTNWNGIIKKYLTILYPKNENSNTKKFLKRKRVFQLLIVFRYGDAISNHSLFIHEYLKKEGFNSNIRSLYTQINDKDNCPYKESEITSEDIIIYHYSMWSELTEKVKSHKGKIILIYHNITPSHFFEKYNTRISELADLGRKDLATLTQITNSCFGDSKYNCTELQELGFKNTKVLPIPFQFNHWKINPNKELYNQLKDGKKNIIFVGRVVPNKKHDDLLFMLYELKKIYKNIRLVFCGYNEEKSYIVRLNEIIERLELIQDVIFLGSVEQDKLYSVYLSADLFVSMSEHEGVCIPIIESMFFDLPVMAYKSSAVPETMGSSGILFNSKKNMREVAALAYILLTDKSIRKKVIESQKERRNDFLLESCKENYIELKKCLEE